MQTAKDRILTAADHIDVALDNLIAEIGTDQFNDLIQVYPEDMQDLLDLKDSLAHYKSYFDGPKEWSIVYNEDWDWIQVGPDWISVYTADTFSATVDISQFFDNPMSNPNNSCPAMISPLRLYRGHTSVLPMPISAGQSTGPRWRLSTD